MWLSSEMWISTVFWNCFLSSCTHSLLEIMFIWTTSPFLASSSCFVILVIENLAIDPLIRFDIATLAIILRWNTRSNKITEVKQGPRLVRIYIGEPLEISAVVSLDIRGMRWKNGWNLTSESSNSNRFYYIQLRANTFGKVMNPYLLSVSTCELVALVSVTLLQSKKILCLEITVKHKSIAEKPSDSSLGMN